jgi:hypothetical protein
MVQQQSCSIVVFSALPVVQQLQEKSKRQRASGCSGRYVSGSMVQQQGCCIIVFGTLAVVQQLQEQRKCRQRASRCSGKESGSAAHQQRCVNKLVHKMNQPVYIPHVTNMHTG